MYGLYVCMSGRKENRNTFYCSRIEKRKKGEDEKKALI
jgi:hypothetical protein